MNTMTTEILFILDRSGSMHGQEADTIGGFNSFIEKQRKEAGETLVSTILFSDTSHVLHDRLLLEQIRPLTTEDYVVGGCTALLDALGDAIHHIGARVHRHLPKEVRPKKTIVVIITDGQENASRRYSRAAIRERIRREECQFGWEFIFLGANMDAIGEAGALGIRRERAARYRYDGRGIRENFDTISKVVCCLREERELSADWKSSIEALEREPTSR